MGATKEQMQGLYDALAQQDRATAETLADRINPTLKELVGRNPTAVMRTAAGLLGDPDRPAREVQWQGGAAPAAGGGGLLQRAGQLGGQAMQQAGAYGQALPGQPEKAASLDVQAVGQAGQWEPSTGNPLENLPPIEDMLRHGAQAAEVVASLLSGGLAIKGGKAAAAPIIRRLATSPRARLVLERAIEGIAGAAGFATPEAILQGSTEPYTRPSTIAGAALPMAGSVLRRLLPAGKALGLTGGAIREATSQAGELAKFSGAADPAVAALTPARVVAESGMTPAPFKPTLTPAMRKELVAMGVPAKSLQRLTPNKAAALVDELTAMKQQIGMGERPALQPPPPVVPPAPVAPPVAAPPVQPPMAAPEAAGPPVAPPVAPAPPMAPPGTVWTPKPMVEPPGGAGGGGAPPAVAVPATAAPAAPVTPATLQPERARDVVQEAIDAAMGIGTPAAQATGTAGIVGQGGGDAGLLVGPATRPRAPRKITPAKRGKLR